MKPASEIAALLVQACGHCLNMPPYGHSKAIGAAYDAAARDIKQAIEAARKEGYKKGLEDAVSVVEGEKLDNAPDNDQDYGYNMAIRHCAEAIRDLAEREE